MKNILYIGILIYIMSCHVIMISYQMYIYIINLIITIAYINEFSIKFKVSY